MKRSKMYYLMMALILPLSPLPVQAAPHTTVLGTAVLPGGLTFVEIPAGEFFMGTGPCGLEKTLYQENNRRSLNGQAPLSSPCLSGPVHSATAPANEQPQHHVMIDRVLSASVTEVTLGQFRPFLLTRPDLDTPAFRADNSRGDPYPVVHVSWQDAKDFIDWLNRSKPKSDRSVYTLPSEAEWEYTARGGSESPFWWGSTIGTGNAICKGCGSPGETGGPAAVATLRSNPFGLYDVAGNVSEWVEDCYDPTYDDRPPRGGSYLVEGDCPHIHRGGAWDGPPMTVRSASRAVAAPSTRSPSIGFRIFRALPE